MAFDVLADNTLENSKVTIASEIYEESMVSANIPVDDAITAPVETVMPEILQVCISGHIHKPPIKCDDYVCGSK